MGLSSENRLERRSFQARFERKVIGTRGDQYYICLDGRN